MKKAYLKEAATELGLTEYQMRRMAKEHRVPCFFSGNRMVFDVELCKEYLRKEALQNVNPIDIDVNHSGVLRRIDE